MNNTVIFSCGNDFAAGTCKSLVPAAGIGRGALVLAPEAAHNPVQDGSLVLGNMMLAAHAVGLGSCWINRAREEFEQPEWKAWLKSLGIEGDYEGIGHLALGYPDGEPHAPKPRKECVVKV